jgi:hypothetical protein
MKTKYNFWLMLLLISFGFLLQNFKIDDLLETEDSKLTTDLISKFDTSIISFDVSKNILNGNLNKEVQKRLSLIEGTYVPDDNFELALINLGYDQLPLDNYVPTKNINKIIKLSVSKNKIEDLTGIEGFSALQFLECSFNNLTTLDLSKNKNLTHVCCHNNYLENLNISENFNLLYLNCDCNRLKSINVENNNLLAHLFCNDNDIKNIDVSRNVSLICLSCNRNNLINLDLSNNINLTHMHSLYNLKLKCIKVNSEQFENIPSDWNENASTEFKTICS